MDADHDNSKAVLVTGAAAGMGLATSRRLLASGNRVVAVDVNQRALADEFGEGHAAGAVLTALADVADADSMDAVVARAVAELGRLDGVVNNAALHGAAWNRPCLSYSTDEWAELLRVNVTGVVNVARAAAPALALAATGGVVVNVSSMVGYGYGRSSPYAVSKAAVNGVTTALASELGALGIRVVGVAPGFIATPFVLSGMSDESQARLRAHQAIDVQGEPDDIAALIEFLLSDQARMITGHTVIADAGITRRP